MKRLLLLAPLLLVVAGCTTGTTASSAGRVASQPTAISADRAQPVLSRASRIDGVPLRLDVADLRRRGPTVTLDLRLRSNAPHGGADYYIGHDYSTWTGGDLDAISLIDAVTGRRLR